jgi:hypothetical protein
MSESISGRAEIELRAAYHPPRWVRHHGCAALQYRRAGRRSRRGARAPSTLAGGDRDQAISGFNFMLG